MYNTDKPSTYTHTYTYISFFPRQANTICLFLVKKISGSVENPTYMKWDISDKKPSRIK